MSNYVSIHSKYYNNSNASGLLAHVDRTFKLNKNVLPSDLPNFGNDVTSVYKETLSKAIESKGKAFRKDSNLYIDSVVSFSREQTEALIEKYGFDNFKKGITKAFEDFQNRMKEEFGLEPCGFNFHMDEGHIDDEGKLIRNYHAHCVFLNYNFKTKKQPWRTLKPKDFSRFQDIAGEAFKKAGYRRGLSKEETKKKHLEKEEFVMFKEKEKELEELQKRHEETVKNNKELVYEIIDLQDKNAKLEDKTIALVSENTDLWAEVHTLRDTVNQLKMTISKIKYKFKKIIGEIMKYSKNKRDAENQKAIEKIIDYDNSLEELEIESPENNQSNIDVSKSVKNRKKLKNRLTF